MTTISTTNGQVIIVGGVVGTEAACCCGGDGKGCCCIEGSPDATKTTQAACEGAGGDWFPDIPCEKNPCGCCCKEPDPDSCNTAFPEKDTRVDCEVFGGEWVTSPEWYKGFCEEPQAVANLCSSPAEFAQGFAVLVGVVPCTDPGLLQCAMTQQEAEDAAAAIQACVDAMFDALPGLGFKPPYRRSTAIVEECPGGGWQVVQDIMNPVGLESDGFYVEGTCCDGLGESLFEVDCGVCGTKNVPYCSGNPLP